MYTATVPVPAHVIADVMVTALEGGSNHWIDHIRLVEGTAGEKPWYADAKLYAGDFKIVIRHDGDNEGFLTPANIQRGLNWLGENNACDLADLIAQNMDATGADNFLQAAVLGEVVYG